MKNKIKLIKEFIFKPDGASECYMCGISSFEHIHPVGSKPKDFIMTDIPYNEIRLDDKGKPDDIAIGEINNIHLERLDTNVWWLGVYKGQKRTTFYIKSKSKISVELVENGLKTKTIKK